MLLPAPPWLLQPPSECRGGSTRVLKQEPPCPALLADTTKQHQQKDKYSELLTWSAKVFMYVHFDPKLNLTLG